jgi:hypothetical protein
LHNNKSISISCSSNNSNNNNISIISDDTMESRRKKGTLQLFTKSTSFCDKKGKLTVCWLRRSRQTSMGQCQLATPHVRMQYCYLDEGTGLFALLQLQKTCILPACFLMNYKAMMWAKIAMPNSSCARKMASTTKRYIQQQQKIQATLCNMKMCNLVYCICFVASFHRRFIKLDIVFSSPGAV